jgi:hypothetical protein
LKTISVLILRVVELNWVRWTIQTVYLDVSKLCSQGHLLATGDLWVWSLPAIPHSAFWLASMLITGDQTRLRLKPLSLLKFLLFNLMWMDWMCKGTIRGYLLSDLLQELTVIVTTIRWLQKLETVSK